MKSIENINQKKRRVAGKVYYLRQYIEDLNKLLFCEVTSDLLISLIETDSFFDKFPISSFELKRKETLNFADKEKLLSITHKEISSWTSPYYVYLIGVEYCGMIEVPSLNSFNWDFNFEDETHGAVMFVRKDGKEKLVLDFYEEFSQYFMDIEIYRFVENKE